jgi:Zn-dependent protease with chaperone function
MEKYRYPGEQTILSLTLVLILAAALLTAGPSIFLIPLAVLVFVFISYQTNAAHHRQIIQRAYRVTADNLPELNLLVKQCADRLKAPRHKVYVLKRNELNAYTFGISDPRVIVIYSDLMRVMDADELRFIIGHEQGHIVFDHAWLNTLLGGMAGVPVPYSAALGLTFVFRWWNRTCEFSADRAGLLACRDLKKATSALVKLAAGDVRTPEQMERALKLVEAEDDSPINVLASTLSTHPMIVNRIKELRKFAASSAYKKAVKTA